MGGLTILARQRLRLAAATAVAGCVLLSGTTARAAPATTAAAAALAHAHTDSSGRLQLDVHVDCSLAAPLAELAAAGMRVQSSVSSGPLCVVEGWALPGALSRLNAVPGVERISAPSYVLRPPPRALGPMLHQMLRSPVQKAGAGSIDRNGITIMRADQFVSQTGVTGAGVTVGVQSSGVYSLSVIQGRGELPSSVQVLYPAGNSTPVVDDEGTALLEEIHAVAPGANLVYCGPSTFVDYLSCLSQLINAGATIVLDDTGFVSDELMSLNNDQSTAISLLLSQHPSTLMLSSAGNNEGTYWEGNYTPVSIATTSLPPLQCPTGAAVTDNYVATFAGATSQTLTLNSYANFPLLLAWSDPSGQLTSHFDVYWFVAGSTTPLGCFSSTGSSNQASLILSLPNGTYSVVVASPDASTAGKFLKLWAGGDGLTSFSVATPGGLISPQAMAQGVLNIGAVNGSDGVGGNIEPFSSSGPLTAMFPAFTQLQAPSLVAPDGISVDAAGTYFASALFPDGNFYGTSAAVPNAGAVAALLRSAFPGLSVAQVTTALQSGATVLGASSPDEVFGYGRVDAIGALNTLPVPTITALADQSSTGSATTAEQSFTVTGTGTLHFAVHSSNAALVPNIVSAAGTPGVAVSAGCGSSVLTCTLTVTPALGQAGSTLLSVSVLDGANRAATAQMTLTETDPAPAPPPPPSPPNPTPAAHGGGGAVRGGSLLVLGALVLWSQRRRFRNTSSA